MQERSIESRPDNHTSGAFSLVVLLLAWPALAGGFAGGTGEPNDPYQIATAEQLTSIGSDPNDLAKHFVLVADIDLDPNLPGNRVFDRAVIAPDTNDTANGFQGPAFTGVFDGWSHTITGLVIDSNVAYAGLFGMIEEGGQVRNLRLVGGSVRGQATSTVRGGPLGGTGGLAAWNQGLVTACGCQMLVRGLHGVGGLVGINDGGMISACYSTGSINGSVHVGGLIGDNDGPVFVSYSTSTVSGNTVVGGLVGYNSYRTICACYSTGSVSGNDFIGGLVGNSLDDGVFSSFWDTETSGQTASNGGTGLTTSQMQAIDTFLDAGWDFVDERANGLCEYWQAPVGGGYPELSIFGGSIPHTLQGVGTAEDPYLLDTAEDLGTVWYRPMASYRLTRDIDVSDITWAMAVIPAFSGRLDGQGHEIFWLTIEGREYLGLIGYLARGAAVSDLGVQTGDVHGTDLVGGLVGMNAGGTVSECYGEGAVNGHASVGVLVGDNSGTVSACYSRGWASGSWEIGGLVGYNSGVISACHGTSWVSGSQSVGGLVGHNGGAISGCDSHSSPVSGGYWVGGLVGSNGGTISACYSTGSIDGSAGVGGLVGDNLGAVSVCYCTGSARGNGSVGGLVGYNYNNGTISACYSTGSVSGPYKVGGLVGNGPGDAVLSCFWDTETSGRTTSDGGTGLTTSQMRIGEIFLNAGWDFMETWCMPAGNYPRLLWEDRCGESE